MVGAQTGMATYRDKKSVRTGGFVIVESIWKSRVHNLAYLINGIRSAPEGIRAAELDSKAFTPVAAVWYYPNRGIWHALLLVSICHLSDTTRIIGNWAKHASVASVIPSVDSIPTETPTP